MMTNQLGWRSLHFRGVCLTLAIAVSLTASSAAQEWVKTRLEKSPRHLEFVKLKSGGRDLEAFIAFPEVKDKAPAVIVIHEIFGLSDWVRGVCDQLAEAGYIAMAPDLLSGSAPNGGGTRDLGGGDAVRKSIQSLKPADITRDLDAVANYLTKDVSACNGKLAVAGFCWGGGQTFRYANHNPNLKAAMVFYGSGPTEQAAVANIKCPVHGFYGENDNRINSGIEKSKKLMAEGSKTYEPILYKEAGHGFMRAGEDPMGNAANVEARKVAWDRIKKILKDI
jgi:carboxymethylenebutenolidase